MENKVNVAEILKHCPHGMKLNSPAYSNLYFDNVVDSDSYPIKCFTSYNGMLNTVFLTKYGEIRREENAKCVIFPKGKTTWEGFVPPCKFKGGDIVVIKTSHNFIFYSIYQGIENREVLTYVDYYLGSNKLMFNTTFHSLCFTDEIVEQRLATKEEKEILFKAIKDDGYEWNPETKTLNKLVEPKFKVGDRIRHKENIEWVCTIRRVTDRYYVDGHPTCYTLLFGKQDEYELVQNKFDVSTLKPFDKVLVRCGNNGLWNPQFFAKYRPHSKFPFTCTYNSWSQCVPYEGNEHLLDTTDDCDNFYKTWE
jgi:hypothetical protein